MPNPVTYQRLAQFADLLDHTTSRAAILRAVWSLLEAFSAFGSRTRSAYAARAVERLIHEKGWDRPGPAPTAAPPRQT